MEQIKALREKTGAGIVDCKKALDEAGGDLDKAVEILRKKGIAKAGKRTDREASEGLVLVAVNADHTEGYILEVNSETDFVSRNDKFQDFSKVTLELIKTNKPADLDALLALSINGLSVKDTLDSLSGTIGEKLGIKNFAILTGATVSGYSHLGGRIGVLVSLSEAGKSELATDIAMQVAAANPKYLAPEEVPADEIAKEKEIYREQLLKEGKPEQMIEKIAEGKINKYYSEVCLLKQEFIKDDKKTVEGILGGTKIEKFIRYSL
ncbi:elongation factor Ts [Candidatus Falkowbacteria bacterium CG_4_10_14_0_2_um_filter_41_15]|uniref:Elongation factor Ts n=1 Tax=Candidatus Falkowbacteria bacterium CG_4_10_14_0_2_um_filter_41_15 TaxID=1974554 RepID=A0A2M7VY55_9BACT|nr:MAG: elongation factor Ts [Candidatus Falkowbacteria bacterium CG_4_10_14_0_2_um_filter_41_15]